MGGPLLEPPRMTRQRLRACRFVADTEEMDVIEHDDEAADRPSISITRGPPLSVQNGEGVAVRQKRSPLRHADSDEIHRDFHRIPSRRLRCLRPCTQSSTVSCSPRVGSSTPPRFVRPSRPTPAPVRHRALVDPAPARFPPPRQTAPYSAPRASLEQSPVSPSREKSIDFEFRPCPRRTMRALAAPMPGHAPAPGGNEVSSFRARWVSNLHVVDQPADLRLDHLRLVPHPRVAQDRLGDVDRHHHQGRRDDDDAGAVGLLHQVRRNARRGRNRSLRTARTSAPGPASRRGTR